ncbi:zf-TFIIB domain-containing protein [Candidatus Gottesmanbacteria bacterium]|nr:zf-TFIIB domain-containing protein [Candidatus Gottesmanbacteria bacterium]
MHCPSCGNLLQKLEVTTLGGIKFSVDHCGYCGGTWFDPFEINRVPYHEVVRLAKLTVLPKHAPIPPRTLLCPRDHTKLERFHSESLPTNVIIFRCHKCHGYWATQKSLEILKETEEKREDRFSKKRGFYKSVSAILWPASFLVLLLIASFVTIVNTGKPQTVSTKATEVITALSIIPITKTSVTISFQTQTPYRSSISYGRTLLDMRTLPISTVPTTSHSRILIGLDEDTSYIYRLTLIDQNNQTLTSPESVFSSK